MSVSRGTSRWATAKEKWEYTWTHIPLDDQGRPDGLVAGIPVHGPEGKESSAWVPFSVVNATSGDGGVLVWWRRAIPGGITEVK